MAPNAAILLDTGPLVAYLDRDEIHHAWATQNADMLPLPFLTCDAVISEACFLLQKRRLSLRPLFELLAARALISTFDLAGNHAAIAALIHKYAALPMSFADACLVRLAEKHADSRVLTLDGHFQIYRIHGRRAIPLIIPSGDDPR